jgi:hypothetical protein
MTWQVEQAREPSHAPSRSMSLSCAMSRRDLPIGALMVEMVPSLSSVYVTDIL